MIKKHINILNFIFLAFGISLLLNSNTPITEAVIGVSDSSSASSIIGLTFILISILLFVGGNSLERILGIHDYENDEEYQKLKEKLKSKGERIVRKESTGRIDFDTYRHFLEKRVYNDFPAKMSKAYENDRDEFLGRKKESDSEANKYLKERLNDINHDEKRVAEITAIIHNEGKKYDEAEVKRIRDDLLEQYKLGKIDETEFAKKLNNIGELVGGVYNPGNRHLSVKIIGYSISIPHQGNNSILARAIHRRILDNSKSYKPNCEFHYSKQMSTKHHIGDL